MPGGRETTDIVGEASSLYKNAHADFKVDGQPKRRSKLGGVSSQSGARPLVRLRAYEQQPLHGEAEKETPWRQLGHRKSLKEAGSYG